MKLPHYFRGLSSSSERLTEKTEKKRYPVLEKREKRRKEKEKEKPPKKQRERERERETREGERAAMNGLSVRTGRANGMPTQAGVSRTTTATRVSHQRQARKVCLQRRRTIECSATAEAEKTANLSKVSKPKK